MFLGGLLARKNVLSVHAGRTISDLILTLLLPSLIFQKIVVNISGADIQNIGVIGFIAFLLFSFGGLMAFAISKFTPCPKSWFGGILSVGIFSNISDLPIAYITTLSGSEIFSPEETEKGIAYIIIYLAYQMLLQFNLGSYRLVEKDFKYEREHAESQNSNLEEIKIDTNDEEINEDISKVKKNVSINESNLKDSSDMDIKEDDIKILRSGFDVASPESNEEKVLCVDEIEEERKDAVSELPSQGGKSYPVTSYKHKNKHRHKHHNRHHHRHRHYHSCTIAIATQDHDESTPDVNIRRGNSLKESTTLKRRISQHPPLVSSYRSSRPDTIDDIISSFSGVESFSKGYTNCTKCKSKTSSSVNKNVSEDGNTETNVTKEPVQLEFDLGEFSGEMDASNSVGNLDYYSRDTSETSGLWGDDSAALETPEYKSKSVSIVSECKPSRLERARAYMEGKNLGFLYTLFENFLRPSSFMLVIAIIIAMIPWVKALFVQTNVSMPNAPDGNPPLSFIIDFTEYLGNACVPLSLLLLGATISRLNVKSIPPGFQWTALSVAVGRLIIMPVIGILIVVRLYKIGWISSEILYFISLINWGLPNATVLVYLTAFYTDPDATSHIQMDCLAVCLLFEYPLLFFSMPFVVTFVLKVVMGY